MPPSRPPVVKSHGNSFTSTWPSQAAQDSAGFVTRPMEVPSQSTVDFPGPEDFMMHDGLTSTSNMYPGPFSSQRTTAYSAANEHDAYGAGPSDRTPGAAAFNAGAAESGIFGGIGNIMEFGFQGGIGGMLDQWDAAAGVSGGIGIDDSGGIQDGMIVDVNRLNVLWGMQSGG